MLLFQFLRIIFIIIFVIYYFLFLKMYLFITCPWQWNSFNSFILLLPYYCNSAPMDCQQKSIYQLHFVQHRITGFLNNNSNKITFHTILSEFHCLPDYKKIDFTGFYMTFFSLTPTTMCFYLFIFDKLTGYSEQAVSKFWFDSSPPKN